MTFIKQNKEIVETTFANKVNVCFRPETDKGHDIGHDVQFLANVETTSMHANVQCSPFHWGLSFCELDILFISSCTHSLFLSYHL